MASKKSSQRNSGKNSSGTLHEFLSTTSSDFPPKWFGEMPEPVLNDLIEFSVLDYLNKTNKISLRKVFEGWIKPNGFPFGFSCFRNYVRTYQGFIKDGTVEIPKEIQEG